MAQNVLNFMQFFFFLENLAKSYVAPPNPKGRPPSTRNPGSDPDNS